MAELSKVLNDSAGIDGELFKELIAKKSLFQDELESKTMFASDFDDEDDVDEDDDFDEEEDLFDEDELEEEGYEEDFDFDEEENDDSEEEDLNSYS